MTAEFFPGDASNTVNNFVFLAREGFYEGVIFHRVIRASRSRAAIRPAQAGADRATSSRTSPSP
jgi:cyclophilin family peptidyl-prolyl cis-trans isomerase